MRERKSLGENTIESFGGTGGLITGSCHKLVIGRDKLLIDAGMFQGRREEKIKGELRNFQSMEDISRGVTDIFITHTHMDHIGRLPIIFKEGFTPNVLTTEETAMFMETMLLNSVKIQKETDPKKCYYDEWDVEKTLKHIKIVKPNKLVSVGGKKSNITAEFLPNGHVVGSASVLIRDFDKDKNILFTGDIGKPNQSLCGGYNEYANRYTQDPINVIMVDSTSFNKKPVNFEEKKDNLLKAIYKVWENGGNPIFPTLSFHRTEEIIELFHHLQKSGEIPLDCKIIIDAPLAMQLFKTFELLGPDHLSSIYGNDSLFYKTPEESSHRFDLNNLTIIESHQASVKNDNKMANFSGKSIIIASGGMGEYGRTVNYMHGNFGKNPKNAFIFNCFQVEGTEGSKLVRRGRNLINGAQVMKLDGFTSHASGIEEYFGFVKRFNLDKLETVIINHGQNETRNLMASEIKKDGFKGRIILPEIGQLINC